MSIKEDGFASWLWRPKWLVLKEQTLEIHKTEVSPWFILQGSCPFPLRIQCALSLVNVRRCTASIIQIKHGPRNHSGEKKGMPFHTSTTASGALRPARPSAMTWANTS